MMRWFGMLLVLAASAALGLGRAAELRQRPRLLRALADSLKLLRSDIAFRLLPLPEALTHGAEAASGPVRTFYASLAEQICGDQRPFAELWTERTANLELPAEDIAALQTLGGQLGKYDADAQVDAIDYCVRCLEHAQKCAQEDADRRGRLYAGLGLTLGLMLAVTLY